MSTGAYLGVGGSAKKIKNIYLGVGNVSKKIKKAYIGVGGVAKLWWKSASIPPISKGSIYYESNIPRPANSIDAKTSVYGLVAAYDVYDEYSALVFVNNNGVTTRLTLDISGSFELLYNAQAGSTANHIFIYPAGNCYKIHQSSNNLVMMYDNNLTYTLLPTTEYEGLNGAVNAGVASFPEKVIFLGGISDFEYGDKREDVHVYSDTGVYSYYSDFEKTLGVAEHVRTGIGPTIVHFEDTFMYWANYVYSYGGGNWRMINKNLVLVAKGSTYEPSCRRVIKPVDNNKVAYAIGGFGLDELYDGYIISIYPSGVINNQEISAGDYSQHLHGGAAQFSGESHVAYGEYTYIPLFVGANGYTVGAILDKTGTIIFIGPFMEAVNAYVIIDSDLYTYWYQNIYKYNL